MSEKRSSLKSVVAWILNVGSDGIFLVLKTKKPLVGMFGELVLDGPYMMVVWMMNCGGFELIPFDGLVINSACVQNPYVV